MPISKRSNTWWIRFQHNGQRIAISAGKGATYEQAKAIEAKARQDIVKGKLGQATYTLEDAAARWLEGEAANLKDYQGLINKVRAIRNHLDCEISKAQTAAQHIIEESEGLSPATINRRLAIIRRLCNLAWKWGWVEFPPKIELIPGEVHRHVYLTTPEVIKLAKRAGPAKWHVILAAFSGLRQGELLRISPADIVNGAIYLRDTKSGKPRLIPLNKPAQCAVERLEWGMPYHTLRWHFEKARGDADIRFHDLRHTAASLMVKGGASLVAVRDVLGHSNLGVTSRYSHLGIDGLREAVDKMVNGTKMAQKKR